MYKVEIFQGKLYVASGIAGVKVYKLEENHQLQYLYNIIERDLYCSDFVIDKAKRLLYIMDFTSGVHVYDIS